MKIIVMFLVEREMFNCNGEVVFGCRFYYRVEDRIEFKGCCLVV